MLHGPTYIFKCTNCDNHISRRSLMSGNTFGARSYSDGRRIAPMLPDFPIVVKCKKCRTFLWLNKLEETAVMDDYFIDDPRYQDAQEAEFLTIKELIEALESKSYKWTKDEKYLRQQVWWTFNDRLRDGKKIFQDPGDEELWECNCRAMLRILEPMDYIQRIQIAEIHRNLGNFDKCLEVLDSIFNPDISELKKQFRAECEKGNRWVFELEGF